MSKPTGKGHGSQERKEEAALAALLSASSIEEAASVAGVAPITLRRWLVRPDFLLKYRQARRDALEGAVAQLQIHLGKAAAAIIQNLESDKPAERLAAAAKMFELAFRGGEVLDLEERLAQVEQRLERERLAGEAREAERARWAKLFEKTNATEAGQDTPEDNPGLLGPPAPDQ
jgi:hypothetical protein